MFQCSSASRKFLNSIGLGFRAWLVIVSVLFSEPKISQFLPAVFAYFTWSRFSALQRAENFSITTILSATCKLITFQCSSASRKFLNSLAISSRTRFDVVSVLFSEPKISQYRLQFRQSLNAEFVSVLFSEPKISQSGNRTKLSTGDATVSVLFSEPKISQCQLLAAQLTIVVVFQCSSASRKFLNKSDSDTY